MTGAPATYFEAERLAVFDRHVGGVEKLNEDVRGADLRRARRKASAPRSRNHSSRSPASVSPRPGSGTPLLEATPWGRRASESGHHRRADTAKGPDCQLNRRADRADHSD